MIFDIIIIISSHIAALLIIIKKRGMYRYELDIEKLYGIVSEYLTTKSILRSVLTYNSKIDKDILFKDRPSLVNEGIDVRPVSIGELGRKHLENRLNKAILRIDEHLNLIDLYGILFTGAVVFPILISSLTLFIMGPLVLATTPFIQLLLLMVVSRWMKR
ncbi:MAG TPA: hypothetical protein EYH44_05935 [Thermoprotei archaeon]|nr:hypothetical protein [Thermoprotei archaeon]